MNILSLTIDLPRTHYTITDKPGLVQRSIDTLCTIGQSIWLALVAIGWAVIDAAKAAGRCLGWLIQTTGHLFTATALLFDIVLFGICDVLAIGRYRVAALVVTTYTWLIAALVILISSLLAKQEGLCFVA